MINLEIKDNISERDIILLILNIVATILVKKPDHKKILRAICKESRIVDFKFSKIKE